MNMTLTITGNAAQLISVLSALNGTTALTPAPAPVVEDDGLHPAFNAVPDVIQEPTPAPVALAEQLLQGHAAQVATTAAPVAAPVANDARDSEGLPWDKRIHASSKNFNADGSWRKKRNLDDTILNAVLAELRATAASAQPVPPMPTMQPAPVAPVVPPMPAVNAAGEQVHVEVAAPVVPVAPAPVPEPVVAQIPVATAPFVPVAATVPATLDMPGFMMHIGPKMGQIGADGSPVLSPEYLAKVAAEISGAFNTPLTVITDIAANPAMIKYAADILARDGKW